MREADQDQSAKGRNISPVLQQVLAKDMQLLDALAAEDLPVDDLTDPGRTFFRFTDRDQTVGYGGLEQCGEDALLRSVVVLPQHRGKGYGAVIIKLLLDQAAADGVRAVYLLTESAATFFEHIGFVRIDRAKAPATILQTRQAASLCPASAALLAKTIRG